MGQIATLSFFRFDRLPSRAWALWMMGAARPAMKKIPDIGFWKLCGSGSGEGFTPIPNTGVYAILATWPCIGIAQDRVAYEPIYKRYRARASEHWTVFLSPTESRGQWSGKEPFTPVTSVKNGPLAALTRATIKPKIMTRFWGKVPDISKVIGEDPNVLFKIGIGEVPWLQQVTFSIWPSPKTMAEFARLDGPHAKAIKAVRDGEWFREELYARFAIKGEMGSWNGGSPLGRTQ
ncbi:MAG: spheroidene monooxygenase [Pseudomonadota bacterium]